MMVERASPWIGFGLLGNDSNASSSTIAAEPPSEADPEYEHGAEEVTASLSINKWLFPPGSTFSPTVAASTGAQAITPEPHPGSLAAAPVPARHADLPDVQSDPALHEEILHSYPFKRLQSTEAKSLIVILLAPAWQRSDGSETYRGIDRAYQTAIREFASQAHTKLTKLTAERRPLIPDSERNEVVEEAKQAMRFLVRKHWLDVTKDLLLCLESFDVGREKDKDTATWMRKCISLLLRGTLEEARPADREICLINIRTRIQSEGSELYSQIDVRAWQQILETVEADYRLLDQEACITQVRTQLCMHSELRRWTEGLKQASEVIGDLHLQFTAEDIYDTFNDKTHFDRRRRYEFLFRVLKDAPRDVIQDVIHLIDSQDTDLAERTDDEIQLVMDLIAGLSQDVRIFNNAYFQMFREWLVGQFQVRSSHGVVSKEELSPEQICDHIEDNTNYVELLKVAVKELLHSNRKFEVARMLARPQSRTTQVFETNRNDKQLAYLVSLYEATEAVEDRFSPIEEECLALPTPEPHLYIDNIGVDMDRLEQDTVSTQTPMVLGIWWFWRCLNITVDNNARASFIAMTYGGTFAIIDIQRLEGTNAIIARKGKDLIARILEAPHILKVVHDLDQRSLLLLQRALLPTEDLNNEKHPILPSLSPVLDVSMVAAFVKQMQPRAPAVTKLLSLTADYLRMEMCMGEALSNFERRPLRLSQLHYALTVAWCPLMILRVLATYEIVNMKDLVDMTFHLGYDSTPSDWDSVLHNIWMCSPEARAAPEACAALDPSMALPGPYGANPWKDAHWVEAVPRPEQNFKVSRAIPQHLDALRLPASGSTLAAAAVATLADGTMDMLEDLYKAYHHANSTGAAGGG